MSGTLATDSTISHYRVVSEIGAGGMGEVYLAEDTRLGRRVALKVLPAEVVDDSERLSRFRQEARSASALNHPNILTVYDIGEEGSTHYIAAEFVEGETLRRRLQRARFEVGETLNVAAQIAAALDAAHRGGIVHRDIKPENVMVRSDGLVKVLDFGLAKLAQQKGGAPADSQAPTRALVETGPGVVMGTVNYMSPEQARGKEVDARTDVFSLGVVLYEMLAGGLPFAGGTASDVIAAILKGEPAPLDEDTPAELRRIVRKCLRKEADERYQTARDLLIDLKALQQEHDFSAGLERSGIQTRDSRVRTTSGAGYGASGVKQHRGVFAVALAALLLAALGFGYWILGRRSPSAKQIESIAVLPLQNASGDPEVEYLSDGITESLINSLSRLQNVRVPARSTVFRFKGKDADPPAVGRQLGVDAVLTGRVVQRGDSLTVQADLINVSDGSQLWGERYNRRLTDLLAVQEEVARDVSDKLTARLARLSGADEQRLAKNYTANPEAYRLYLKGRYHAHKRRLAETQKAISYFQQAIALDPSYALAYAGLADAYLSMLAADMPPTEFLPKARAAAQKAVEIDDTLAAAHAVLGYIIFWYDWDWSAAEDQFRRALELDPNSADARLFYAHLLSNMGRHAEGLAQAERARELDPLNLLIGALEGLFLNHAGRADEALARLQKTFELDANSYLAHMCASSAYIEKGMYEEAVAEAQKASEVSGASNTHAGSLLGYALAKSGKRAEARDLLEGMLKLSAERYVSAYNIALIYHGLGDADEALRWLARGYAQRDPKLVFLKVEPKWHDLRSDPRFQDLVRRVGLPQ